jgi:tripartite-type tricarboxylate transporter receptor subunit TctC
MVAGQTQVMISALPGTVPFINAKRLIALATSGKKRSVFLPNLPTLSESGVKDYEFDTWYGMHAPIKVPREIITRLNGAIVKSLANADVKQQLANQGIEVSSLTPEEFTLYVRSEIDKMGRIIKASGAKPE